MKKQAVVTALLFALLGCFSAAMAADEADYKIRPSDSLRGILQARVGEQVFIQTRGGSEISGRLKSVGEQVIQISRVARRDFYDAIVRIDAVESVMVRVRGLDRR